MNKRSISVSSLFVILLLTGGCDSGTQSTQVQDNVEIKWQSDGSSIFGFLRSYTVTSTSAVPFTGYSIVRCNNDGSVAETYKTDPKSRPIDPATGNIDSYSSSLYVSPDGNTVVTQLEGDLYRYHPHTGVLEKLVTQLHLIVSSPDLHYAVGTPSPDVQPIKTINVYDLSSAPIRLVTHFDVNRISASSGIWFNNGTFGVNCTDTLGAHISIFDTTSTGTPPPLNVIGSAEAVFHNFFFNSQTNDLFFRNRNSRKDGASFDGTVDRINLTSMVRANVLNLKVENFDVTKDESTIVYSAYDSAITIHMRSRNLQSSKELQIADDIKLIIALSPTDDKLAYIRGSLDHNEIHVIPFIKP